MLNDIHRTVRGHHSVPGRIHDRWLLRRCRALHCQPAEKVIEPNIRDLDFDHVLELAPEHDRNTESLRCKVRTIHLVDVIST